MVRTVGDRGRRRSPGFVTTDVAPLSTDAHPPVRRRSHAAAGGIFVPPVPGQVVAALVVAAGLVGLGIRLWFIFHTPSNADEDVAGLLATNALHGHFQAFYGGQSYGGTAEPVLIAIAFAVFGQTIVVGRLVLVVLDATAAILVWRITLRITAVRSVALLAGALAWCAPAVVLRDTVRLYGFRGVTMVCGLALVLLTVRIHDGRRHWSQFALLGLAAGVGWWSSPEIAYFAVPALILLVMDIIRSHRSGRREWSVGLAVTVVAFGVGALPWIWSNVRSGLASLSTGQLASSAPDTGYVGRLGIFFHAVLPMTLGLTRAVDGHRLLGSAEHVVEIAFLAVIGVAVVMCVQRGGPSLAVAVAVIAFPFLYAYSPASWAWADGRYCVYLPPLLAVTLAVGATEFVRRIGLGRDAGTWLMAGALLVAGGLSAVGARSVVSMKAYAYTSTWGDPDVPTSTFTSRLEAAGVHTAYAGYWVAYKVDFAGHGNVTVTSAGYETDRSAAIDAAVADSADPAWIFVPADEVHVDHDQFTNAPSTASIDTVTEPRFEATLRSLHVPYRVLDLGIAHVVVPARKVTPWEAGLPGSSPP